MASKEDFVLELFYNEPTKHWHFEDILKTAKISRPQAAAWLKKFEKEGLAKRVKEKGGTFLATCYLLPERDMLAEALAKRGLKPELFENDFSPQEYWAQAGSLTRKPDGFVVRV